MANIFSRSTFLLLTLHVPTQFFAFSPSCTKRHRPILSHSGCQFTRTLNQKKLRGRRSYWPPQHPCNISKRITFTDRCRICSSPAFFPDILGIANKALLQLQDKQTDLGKAAQLISSLRENLLIIRNSNLTERYSDSSTELCKKMKHFTRNFMQMNLATVSLMSFRSFFVEIQLFVPEGQTFLFIDLKDYANAYSLNANDLQHEMPLVKMLLLKKTYPPKSLVKFLSFLCSYKTAQKERNFQYLNVYIIYC